MDPSIQVAGLTIYEPVTVVTDFALAAQCALYHRRLRRESGGRRAAWAMFFLAMAVSTGAGTLKHGFPHALPDGVYGTVLWVVALASALSVYHAQRATLLSPWIGIGPTAWQRVPAIQGAAFVVCGLAFGPAMWLVVLNTAVGLVPVLVAEAVAAGRGSRSSTWVATGLAVSMLTAFVYVGRLSAGIWFTHNDVAHCLMWLSFVLIVRGGATEDVGVLLPVGARGALVPGAFRPAGQAPSSSAGRNGFPGRVR
jgi:hypothetical protein